MLTDQKGSCSSKHALLRSIAIEQEQVEPKLILAIYKMNAENTNGLNTVLSKHSAIDFIPEAHCYLKAGDHRFDFTRTGSSFDKISNAILLEEEISPEQVVDYKPVFHKKYIKNWLFNSKLNYSFDEFWEIQIEKHFSK